MSAVAAMAAMLLAIATVPGPVGRTAAALGPAPRSRAALWCDRHLRRADLDRRVKAPLMAWAGVGGLGLGASWVVGASPSVTVVVVVLSILVPPVVVALRGDRHRRRLRDELPQTIETFARELRLGSTHTQAAVAVAASPSLRHSSIDFADIVHRVEQGARLTDAMDTWSRDAALGEVRLFVATLQLGRHLGGDQSGALEQIASALRCAHGAELDARSLAAQSQLSARVIGCAPVIVGAIALLVDRSVTAVVTQPIGLVSVGAGLALNAAGFCWMHRIVARS